MGSQLNPPLSVAWKFGANYTTNRDTALLTSGEEYLDFFNLISDGTNVYATASKNYFPSPGSPGSGRGAYLLALSLESGKALWEMKLPVIDPKGSGLAFLNNDSNTHMLIVGMAGALLSVDDRQERAVWSVNGSDGFPLASPDGRVYTAVGSFWGGNGSKICSYQGGGRIPTYGDGRVYTMGASGQGSSYQGILHAFDARTCAQLWTTPLGSKGDQWASYWSTFHDGRVYAADDTNLYAVDAASGKIIWNVADGEQDFWPPAVHGNVVYLAGYVSSGKAGVAAFNGTNGQALWRSESMPGDYFGVRPSASGKLVYAAIGCTIAALDSQTGKASWQWSLDGCFSWYAYYGPLISSSYLILSDDVSYLVAFRGNLSN